MKWQWGLEWNSGSLWREMRHCNGTMKQSHGAKNHYGRTGEHRDSTVDPCNETLGHCGGIVKYWDKKEDGCDGTVESCDCAVGYCDGMQATLAELETTAWYRGLCDETVEHRGRIFWWDSESLRWKSGALRLEQWNSGHYYGTVVHWDETLEHCDRRQNKWGRRGDHHDVAWIHHDETVGHSDGRVGSFERKRDIDCNGKWNQLYRTMGHCDEKVKHCEWDSRHSGIWGRRISSLRRTVSN